MDQTTGGQDWGSWLQDIGKTLVSGYAGADAQNRSQDFEIQKAQLQYLGQNGYYTAGQPGQYTQAAKLGNNSMLIFGVMALAAIYLVMKA